MGVTYLGPDSCVLDALELICSRVTRFYTIPALTMMIYLHTPLLILQTVECKINILQTAILWNLLILIFCLLVIIFSQTYIVSEMTYYVSSGTLNSTNST